MGRRLLDVVYTEGDVRHARASLLHVLRYRAVWTRGLEHIQEELTCGGSGQSHRGVAGANGVEQGRGAGLELEEPGHQVQKSIEAGNVQMDVIDPGGLDGHDAGPVWTGAVSSADRVSPWTRRSSASATPRRARCRPSED